MSNRVARIPLVVALLFGAAAVACSCSAPPPDVATETVPVPAELRDRYPGATFETASTTSSGTIELGIAVVGTSVDSNETSITVVGWLTSDSDTQQLLHADKDWMLPGFSILDEDGTVIVDEFIDNLMVRGGGPTIEPVGAGAIRTRERSFTLPGPGRYTIVAYASYQLVRADGDSLVDVPGSTRQALKTAIEIVIE